MTAALTNDFYKKSWNATDFQVHDIKLLTTVITETQQAQQNHSFEITRDLAHGD